MAGPLEYHLRRYLLIDIGLFMYVLYFISPLTFELFNIIPIRLSHLVVALGLITFGSARLFLRDHADQLVTPQGRFFIIVLTISIFGILAKSIFVDKNERDLVYIDLEAALLFLSGILLGSNHANWPYIRKVFLRIMMIGIIVNLAAIPLLQSFARTDTENSLLNKMQTFLFPAFFFIFLYPFTNGKAKYVYMAAFVLLFIDQLLFQKRLPIIRLLSTILLFSFIVPTFKRTPAVVYLLNMAKYTVILVGMIGLVVLVAVNSGFNLSQSFDDLVFRFTSSGTVARTAIEDGRYQLAMNVFYKILSSGYFLFGQGFGGVLTGGMIYWTLQTSSSLQTYATNSIEIGQIWPVWKGGIFFWLLVTSTFLYGIFRFHRAKWNWLAIACWAFILITWLFLFGENFWHSPLFILLIGCALGYLLNRHLDRYNHLETTSDITR